MSRQQTLASQVHGGFSPYNPTPARPAAAWQRTAQPGGGQGIQQPQFQGGQSQGNSALAAMMGMFGGELANAPSVPQWTPGGQQQIPSEQLFQQPQPAQPMQVSTGITQPDFAAPEFGAVPAPMEGISPIAAQAAQGGLAQQLQPMQAEAMQQFYTGSAGLQDAFMRSQAQAGLGWGGLGVGMQGLQNQQQGNLLRFLSGMA